MNKKLLFIFSFIMPLIFFRIHVFLNNGKVSILRELTGLKVHHSHYGIILISITIILLLFYKINNLTTFLSGLGVGTMLDSFISSLFPSINRVGEIANYNAALIPTLFLFIGIVFIVLIMNKKK